MAFGSAICFVVVGAALRSARGAVSGAAFGSERGAGFDSCRGAGAFASLRGSLRGAVLVSARGFALVLGLGSTRDAAAVPVRGAARSVPAVARGSGLGAPADDFIPAGGATLAAAKGLVAAASRGWPPFDFENEALSARAVATCAVW
jgi:hypothetical protein